MVKLLDFFHRTWNVFLLAKYGKMDVIEKKKAEEESKSIVGAFSKLRFEIMTDKKIKLLSGSETDISIWNQYYQNYLTKFDCEPSYFTASWLYGECYMYRKVQEILETSKYFVGFDPFHDQKRQGLKNLMQNAVNLGLLIFFLGKFLGLFCNSLSNLSIAYFLNLFFLIKYDLELKQEKNFD